MFFYYGLAAIAATLVYLAGWFEQRKNLLLAITLYISAVAVLCYFAGARDIHVGTDTGNYALMSYRAASTQTFESFWFRSAYSAWAPLYKMFCWAIVNVARSFSVYLFSIELLIVLPVVIVARKMLRNYCWLAILIFGIVFYPMSFNMMRQMIAMGYLLLALVAAMNKRFWRYLVWLVISIGFHTTAIVGVLFYPLVLFAQSQSLGTAIKIIVIFIAGIVFVAAAPTLIALLPGEHYQAYIGEGTMSLAGGARMPLLTSLLTILIGVFGWLFTRSNALEKERLASIVEMTIVFIFGVACLALSIVSFYLYRIGFFFMYVSILLLPLICSSIEDRYTRYSMVLVVVSGLAIWSFDYYVIEQSHEVIPYAMSKIHL